MCFEELGFELVWLVPLSIYVRRDLHPRSLASSLLLLWLLFILQVGEHIMQYAANFVSSARTAHNTSERGMVNAGRARVSTMRTEREETMKEGLKQFYGNCSSESRPCHGRPRQDDTLLADSVNKSTGCPLLTTITSISSKTQLAFTKIHDAMRGLCHLVWQVYARQGRPNLSSSSLFLIFSHCLLLHCDEMTSLLLLSL